MPIVRFKGFEVTCGTAAEAADVIARLQAEEAKKIERRTPGLASAAEALVSPAMSIAKMFADTVETSYWTRGTFWQFIDSLGNQQKHILRLLLDKKRVTDDQLRKALKIETNQQLAGILSGISKQAGSQNIPARAVYTIENESKSGTVTKTYVVAVDFLRIATEMNWEE
jgi:hypothetical protein